MRPLERLLAAVPPVTYTQPGLSGKQSWTADYNVSCWARGRTTEATTVSLVLRYRDATGERQVVVDRATCGKEASMLLSGRASVPAAGRIEEMTVWLLSSPACDLFVDELFCQRVGAVGASRPLLAVR